MKSGDNDWFGENQDRDLRDTLNRRRRELLINPPPYMVKGTKYMTIAAMVAIALGFDIVVLATAFAIALEILK